MSQFSNDIDSLSKYGLEDLDSATFDRILGYTKSGKISESDINSISKLGLEKLDSSSIDRVLQIVDKENINQPKQPTVKEVPKTAGEQLLDFGRRGVEAAFPRLTGNTTGKLEPKEIGKDVVRGSLDALSFLPRFAASEAQTGAETLGNLVSTGDLNDLKNIPSRFLENLKVTETPKGTGVLGFVEDVGRSPFVAVPGAGQVGSGVIGVASHIPLGIGSKVATVAPKIIEAVGPKLGAIATGVGDIAMGTGMGTAESVAKNEGVNPLGAGLGGILGSINPALRGVKGAANWWSDKSVGEKMLEGYQRQYLTSTDPLEKAYALSFLNDYAKNKSQSVKDEIALQMDMAFPNRPRFQQQDKTIKQTIDNITGWEKPNVPRDAATWTELSRYTNVPREAATESSMVKAIIPLLWPKLVLDVLKQNPHVSADVLRYIPKSTGTVTRNVGVLGMNELDNQR